MSEPRRSRVNRPSVPSRSSAMSGVGVGEALGSGLAAVGVGVGAGLGVGASVGSTPAALLGAGAVPFAANGPIPSADAAIIETTRTGTARPTMARRRLGPRIAFQVRTVDDMIGPYQTAPDDP